MWIEYMAVRDRAEALELMKACADMKPAEKDEIYIVKEQEDFFAVLKIKKFRKKIKEQKWALKIEDKGIWAERSNKKEEISEWVTTILFVILSLLFIGVSFLFPVWRIAFIWVGVLFLFFFMFFSWKKLFKPSVSLKIFMVRLL